MFSTALLPIPWSNLFSTASSSAIRANPSRRRARSSKPRLPAELESMVLDTFHDLRNPKDLTWLWVGGRHVSKHFRSDIERIFRTVLLPETILRCDLGLQLRSWDVFKTWGESYGVFDQMSTFIWPGVSCFILDRFSDDQTKAFLKCEEYTNRASKDVVFRRLHEKQLVGAPLFSIQVREVVNDTGLPELQIDDQKEEISFNWKGMLDQLLGEEHVFNTILAQRLGWHLDPGKDTPSLLGTHRKLARRSRLQRECRAKYGSNILEHYTYDEAHALKSIHKLRLAASGIKCTNERYDDIDDDDDSLAVYTKQDILKELPDNAIIYSGNWNPGLKPGSVPRGLFTDQDYCWRGNAGEGLPPPSAADLFSPRPLPNLSRGRQPMNPPQNPKGQKRAMEDDQNPKSQKKPAKAVAAD